MASFIKDERINIARGKVVGTSFIHKFGAVPSMRIDGTGTVWDINDTIYPWDAFDTPSTLTVPAVSNGDDGNVMVVHGLDENFEEQEETFTLSSSSTVNGTKLFSRVLRAYYALGSNADVIDVNVGSTTVLRINEGVGQSLMCIYSVPAGYTGYIMQGGASIMKEGDATISVYIRFPGQTTFRVGHTGETVGTGTPYMYKFAVPIAIPAGTDIDVRANVRTKNSRVSAALDIILVADTT